MKLLVFVAQSTALFSNGHGLASMLMNIRSLSIAALFSLGAFTPAAEPVQLSGIYPHLATFNNEGECGTGAVVPWADRLWVISYGPHLPFGSSDKLYEITPGLQQIIRPESVGGTPANRMIHRESNQLIIGPYLIDAERKVRVIPPKLMPGRLTGNARHLTDPANKIYFATMEEGLYEVDVHSLEVTGLIEDGNPDAVKKAEMPHPAKVQSDLPGYHGKGLYSSQGRVVYANNGDRDKRVLTDPTTPSGALGEWRQPGDNWQLVRRNQFTEVTGPGGIHGSEHPDTDPIWSIGWDARSLILMLLNHGTWHSYRLPKGSHSYDGAHGWNTEWPRIREIGEADLLMTMHGTMWHFPKTFSLENSAGITPRNNYLKVIGDFCRWQDRLVFGCDDTAKSEFLNKRKAKGDIAGPGQSQSNLWFVDPTTLDHLGPVIGRGAVWLNDDVKAGEASDAYLFSGYTQRTLHLTHDSDAAINVTIEIDAKGNHQWQPLRSVTVPAHGYAWTEFTATETGAWVRLKTDREASKATAFFHYRNADTRSTKAADLFAGIATPEDKAVTGGLIYARGAGLKTLRFVTNDGACYDMGADLKLAPVQDEPGVAYARKNFAIPKQVLTVDAASVLYEDDKGRWRLPKGDAAFDQPGMLGEERVSREVCTERDLFNAHGTFYELPAENAGGVAKIRPICTHNRRIKDYCSYRGLMIISGIANEAKGEHILRSTDGKAALWAGTIDDLWQFGKPRGIGGPWKDSKVKANEPSDAYLMTGYDQKQLTLSADHTTNITVEVDLSGTGQWVSYQTFKLEANKPLEHRFPKAFTAYWVRVKADADCTATAQLVYN